MQIKKAEFIISNTDVTKCPKEWIHEYAFIGRSNVGKSSLINTLTDNKSLAKISVKPGKTQLINHFKIDDSWFLVDLPGYGYAQVSKAARADFKKMIEQYILNRKQLICLFVLIDMRIPPQQLDIDFIEFLGINQISFCLVFTKADKVKKQHQQKTVAQFEKKMMDSDWESMPPYFVTSSVKKMGKDEILNYIRTLNKEIPLQSAVK